MDQVKHNIESLHEDLKKIDDADGETPESVTKMLATTRDALDTLDDDTHRETLRAQLEEAIISFENEHPHLMNRIRAIIAGLNNAGI